MKQIRKERKRTNRSKCDLKNLQINAVHQSRRGNRSGVELKGKQSWGSDDRLKIRRSVLGSCKEEKRRSVAISRNNKQTKKRGKKEIGLAYMKIWWMNREDDVEEVTRPTQSKRSFRLIAGN